MVVTVCCDTWYHSLKIQLAIANDRVCSFILLKSLLCSF